MSLDKQMLLPVGGLKEALRLDDDAVPEDKVGGVGMCALRDDIGKLSLLVDLLSLYVFDLCSDAVL